MAAAARFAGFTGFTGFICIARNAEIVIRTISSVCKPSAFANPGDKSATRPVEICGPQSTGPASIWGSPRVQAHASRILLLPLYLSGLKKGRNRRSIFGEGLIWIAVQPMLPWLRRRDHRMSTGVRVLTGVLIRRAVAAQRNSTRLARP